MQGFASASERSWPRSRSSEPPDVSAALALMDPDINPIPPLGHVSPVLIGDFARMSNQFGAGWSAASSSNSSSAPTSVSSVAAQAPVSSASTAVPVLETSTGSSSSSTPGANGVVAGDSGSPTGSGGAQKRMRPERDRGRMRASRARRQPPYGGLEAEELRGAEPGGAGPPSLAEALCAAPERALDALVWPGAAARPADLDSGGSDSEAAPREAPESPAAEGPAARAGAAGEAAGPREGPGPLERVPDPIVQRIFACVGPLAAAEQRLAAVCRRFAALLRGVEWDGLALEAVAAQGGGVAALRRAAERLASGRVGGVRRLSVRVDGRCAAGPGPGGRQERPAGARQAAAAAGAQLVDVLAACVRQPLAAVALDFLDYRAAPRPPRPAADGARAAATEEEQRAARVPEPLPLEDLLLRAALALAPCPALRSLALSHAAPAASNAALPAARWRKALGLLPALEALALPRGLLLTAAHAAAAAAALPALASLDCALSPAPGVGEALAALAPLAALRELRLAAGPRDGGPALGDGLAALAAGPAAAALRRVDLAALAAAVPAAGLAALGRLPALTALSLRLDAASGAAAAALGLPPALRELAVSLAVPAAGDGGAGPLAALASAAAAAPALRSLDVTITGATEYDRAALDWPAAAALVAAARRVLRRWSASTRGVPSSAAVRALAACEALAELRLRMRVEDELDIAPLAALAALAAPPRPARLLLHVDAPAATARPAVAILRRWLPAAAVHGPPGSNL